MNRQYVTFFVISIVVGVVVFFAQGTISFKPDNKNINENEQPTKLIDTIPLADAIILRQNANNIFIDVREKQFYNYAHINGAINLPVDIQDGIIWPEIIKKLKIAPNIIIYGISNADDMSYRLAQFLISKGINNIKIYKDGWVQWKACKLPVEVLPITTSNSNPSQ